MTIVSHAPVGEGEAKRAAQFVERVVGNAWATDAAGRFVYVTPGALKHLGLTLEELNTASEDEAFGWRRVIHPADYEAAAEAWARCLQTGEHYNVEHRMVGADGVYVWGRCSGQPVKDAQGGILGWYGTVIDRDAVAITRMRDNELREVAPRDAPGSLHIVHPDDRRAALDGMTHAFWTGLPYVAQLRLKQLDGSYAWTETTLESPRYDADGVLRWQGESRLVAAPETAPHTAAVGALTASPETEAAAARAIAVIESLFGNAWAIDPQGKLTYVTPFSLGNMRETIDSVNAAVDAGHTAWRPHTHPDDYEGLAAAWRHCLETGDNFFYEHRVRLNAGYAWNRSVAYPIRDDRGRITAWYGTSITTDVYKRNEDALRERERELAQLIDMIPSHIWRLSASGEPVFFNKRMVDFLGIDVADALERGGLQVIIDAIHADDARRFAEGIQQCLSSGESFALQYRLRRIDGAYRWMSSRAEPRRDEEGRIVQWIGLCHDIDEQMEAQAALRERERFLWQLVETLPAMIDCAAPNGEPVYRSQQLRDFLGYQLEELDGTGKLRLEGTLDAGVHPDDLDGVKQAYVRSLRSGEAYARRHRLRRFDGEYRWVETRAAPMRGADGGIVQWNVICLDIDAEVRAQEELRLAQDRLARASQAASLAELSASIAHEVNQPLAAVVTNSHACQRWLSAQPPNMERARVTVERIIRDANAAADVVSRIRALFKQSDSPRVQAPLAEIIAEAGRLLADVIRKLGVRLEVAVSAELMSLSFDSVQLQQVLINLMRNAAEAMEAQDLERVLKVRAFGADNMVQIEIADNGPGIDDPERVFDAFYSTKDSGMGMGLAISRSIIEGQGGRLWFENRPGGGATFAFSLPVQANP